MNKLRAGVEVRKEMALELFKRELFGVSKSLAETSTTFYHGNKADILKRFISIDQHNIRKPSAAVIDLSPIVKGIDVTHCRTFYDFAQVVYSKVIYHFSTNKRIDLIVDRYFRNSLKENPKM